MSGIIAYAIMNYMFKGKTRQIECMKRKKQSDNNFMKETEKIWKIRKEKSLLKKELTMDKLGVRYYDSAGVDITTKVRTNHV